MTAGGATSRSGPGLLHVGYAKALSTWLQRFLFVAPPFAMLDRREVVDTVVRPGALDFDVEIARQRLALLATSASAEGAAVLSEERLCGDPHSGGHDSKEIADRLHALYPAAAVLIVVREQLDMIVSTYHQYLRDGGTLRAAAYLAEHADPTIPRFRYEHFAYDRLVGYYQARFGTDRVLVLPMELFREAPATFVERVGSLVGVEIPPDLPFAYRVKGSQGAFSLTLRRRYNRYCPPRSIRPGSSDRPLARRAIGALSRLDVLVPHPVQRRLDQTLVDLVRERSTGRYEASNQRLSELIGLDLSRYGYSM